MYGLILAAGRGSRMGAATDDRPKALVELNGIPLISWQMSAFRSAGIKTIGVVTGYRAELLEPYGDRHFHNENWATTNMVASLRCASEWLAVDNCIISYSDIVYDPSAIELLTHSTSDLAITYDPDWLKLWALRFEDPLTDAETFRVDETSMLLEIGGSPKSIEEVQGQYMGLLKIGPTGWQILLETLCSSSPELQQTMHLTTLLDQLTSNTPGRITCLAYRSRWAEVDSTTDLTVAERLFSPPSDGLAIRPLPAN